MSSCNLDHSVEDVKQKLESQKEFVPVDLYNQTKSFLEGEVTQFVLNEVFHLLKKYDLAPTEEQQARNDKLSKIVQQ